MHPSEISLDKLQLGEVSQNGRGGKSASISVNGKPLRLTLRSCTTPFEVSSYDRVSDRKSLDLRADSHTIAFMDRLDAALKKEVCGQSRLCGERLHLVAQGAKGGVRPAIPQQNNNHARGEISLQVL